MRRYAVRLQQSFPPPLADRFYFKLHAANQHPTAAQLKHWNTSAGFIYRRWDSLSLYAKIGHLPIDNNAVENAIRPVALGKKNWLFGGSERAGRRAAAIFRAYWPLQDSTT